MIGHYSADNSSLFTFNPLFLRLNFKNLSLLKNWYMDLKDYVAVSGLPGLFRIVTPRGNGLVVEEIDSGKRKFVSMRKHQFTPLDSVGIFT